MCPLAICLRGSIANATQGIPSSLTLTHQEPVSASGARLPMPLRASWTLYMHTGQLGKQCPTAAVAAGLVGTLQQGRQASVAQQSVLTWEAPKYFGAEMIETDDSRKGSLLRGKGFLTAAVIADSFWNSW